MTMHLNYSALLDMLSGVLEKDPEFEGLAFVDWLDVVGTWNSDSVVYLLAAANWQDIRWGPRPAGLAAGDGTLELAEINALDELIRQLPTHLFSISGSGLDTRVTLAKEVLEFLPGIIASAAVVDEAISNRACAALQAQEKDLLVFLTAPERIVDETDAKGLELLTALASSSQITMTSSELDTLYALFV